MGQHLYFLNQSIKLILHWVGKTYLLPMSRLVWSLIIKHKIKPLVKVYFPQLCFISCVYLYWKHLMEIFLGWDFLKSLKALMNTEKMIYVWGNLKIYFESNSLKFAYVQLQLYFPNFIVLFNSALEFNPELSSLSNWTLNFQYNAPVNFKILMRLGQWLLRRQRSRGLWFKASLGR
jgi:hypothetical protein